MRRLSRVLGRRCQSVTIHDSRHHDDDSSTNSTTYRRRNIVTLRKREVLVLSLNDARRDQEKKVGNNEATRALWRKLERGRSERKLKEIRTFLVIVGEAVSRDCASFDSSLVLVSYEYRVVDVVSNFSGFRQDRGTRRRWNGYENASNERMHFSSCSRPQGSTKRRRQRRRRRRRWRQGTTERRMPTSNSDYTTTTRPARHSSFSPKTRQKEERDGSNRTRQTQRNASHKCQPATPDLFLSSPSLDARRDPIRTLYNIQPKRNFVQKTLARSEGRGDRSRRRRPKVRVTTSTTNYELRTTNHGLRTTNHGLRTTNHGLRTAKHGSRITDHGPWTTDYGPRTVTRRSSQPTLVTWSQLPTCALPTSQYFQPRCRRVLIISLSLSFRSLYKYNQIQTFTVQPIFSI